MLAWSQIIEAAQAGIEVGAHSDQHPQLDQLPTRLLRRELHTSKQMLEDKLGYQVPGLAYPFGYSNAKVRQVARAASYAYGYAVQNMMASPASDPFALPRMTIQRSTTILEFQQLISGHATAQLLRERALTKAWATVRRARATVNTTSRRIAGSDVDLDANGIAKAFMPIPLDRNVQRQ